MRPGPLRAVLCVLLLLAACSLILGATLSVAYLDSVTTASNTFTAAPDATAPSATASAIGRSTAYDTGFIAQGSSYYVYANVSDTGNPASGIATVAANVSSITSSGTAVALTAGSYSGGGTAYGYRSAALTAPSTLTAGTRSYTITSTDVAANVATQSFNTVVDNTAPAAVDVQSTNVSGGTAGKIEKGDTLALSTNAAMDPYSILPAWTGATINAQVALVDGGGTSSDYLLVYNTAATPTQIPLGQVNLNATGYLTRGTGTYVTYGAAGAAVHSTITRSGSTITVSLGTASASVPTSFTAARMTWAPSTSATDIAGNATTTAIATQSGVVRVNF